MPFPIADHINFATTTADSKPAWIAEYVQRFHGSSVKEKADILQVFERYTGGLPLAAQAIIYQTAKDTTLNASDENGIDLWNTALAALHNCPDLKSEAIELLTPCLYNRHWFVRGNAAFSLAKIGADSPVIISRIGDLIFDHEGHHWSAGSAALEALEIYGAKANSEIPKLIQLTSNWLETGEFSICSQYEGSDMLTSCFAAIGNDSPEVISVLQRMVSKQMPYSFGASLALGYLGAASLPALPAIVKYVLSEENPADSVERAHALLSTLSSIVGKGNPVIEQYLRYLLQSPFEKIAGMARCHLTGMTQGQC